MKKISVPAAFVLALSFLFFSCKKDNNSNANANMYNINASLSGAQEAPNPVTTNGTGTVTGTYDANTNLLTYHVTWSNLSGPATAAHFHGPAAAGTNASVVVPFTINANGTSADGTITLTEAQEADFLNGMWYANVHTAAHAAGEIRGQVTATHQ
jgi:hypothetical protein